jgi:hypothetical protein
MIRTRVRIRMRRRGTKYIGWKEGEEENARQERKEHRHET